MKIIKNIYYNSLQNEYDDLKLQLSYLKDKLFEFFQHKINIWVFCFCLSLNKFLATHIKFFLIYNFYMDYVNVFIPDVF